MITYVQQATLSVIPPEKQLPSQAMGAFMLLHKTHAVWCYYRKWRIYSNPDNFPTLMAGIVIQQYTKENHLLRISAQCVLIVTRILACAEQHKSFYKSYQALKDTFHGAYPMVASESTLPFLSYNASYHLKQTAARLQEVVKSSFKLLLEAFKLSMCYMDAIEAFSFSAESQDDAIREIFVNSFQSVDALAENKPKLLEQLKSNRELISRILKPFPGGCTVEHLISGVSSTISGAEKVSQTVKGSSVWNGVKTVCHYTLTTLRFSSPHFLLPTLDDSNLDGRPRFPPKKIVTLS